MTTQERTLTNLVTVIIPVGPGHEKYLPQALNSVRLQTIKAHETIVVNDSGKEILESVKYTLLETSGGKGAGYSRNLALEKVSTPFVIFLDADDLLTSTALESLLRRYALGDSSYVYGDWYDWESDGTLRYLQATHQDRREWLHRCCHIVTTLVPTAYARAIEGFDETLQGWEDWEFYLRLNLAGYCGGRVPSPIMAYRLTSGERRKNAFQINESLLKQISATYGAYQKGEMAMASCGGCGGDGGALAAAQNFVATLETPVPHGRVRMEYLRDNRGGITYKVNGREYTGANTPFEKFVDALPEDVQGLLNTGAWRQATMPASQPALPPLVAPFTPESPKPEITNAPPKRVKKTADAN